MARPGIDPGTVRLVAQRLNQHAAPGPAYRSRFRISKSFVYLKKCRDSVIVSLRTGLRNETIFGIRTFVTKSEYCRIRKIVTARRREKSCGVTE